MCSPSVRATDQWGRVAGSDQGAGVAFRVPLGVHTGGEGSAGGVTGERVESAYQLGRRDVEPRQGADGCAELDHGDGRFRTMAHGVPDDQTHTASGPRQYVEPVTADDVVVPGGEVAVGDAAALECLGGGGQQAVAYGQGGATLALVTARVVQGHTGPGGQRLDGHCVAGQERRSARATAAGDEADGGAS